MIKLLLLLVLEQLLRIRLRTRTPKENPGWSKLFLEAFKLNFKCGNYAFIKLKDGCEETVLE